MKEGKRPGSQARSDIEAGWGRKMLFFIIPPEASLPPQPQCILMVVEGGVMVYFGCQAVKAWAA